MESDLLGAHAMGVRNLMVVTGDVLPVGDYADATAVFEVDSIGLTNALRRLNEGTDIGGRRIGVPTGFHIGVQINPGAADLDEQLRRVEYKVQAGAEFAFTTPVFDADAFERFLPRLEQFGIPIVASIWPLDSVAHAEFMANEIPDTRVPAPVLERLRAAQRQGTEAAEGVAIACEVALRLMPSVQGLHIAAGADRPESIVEVLSALGKRVPA
jgi:homocysteine S-methyltransferase